MAVMVLMPRGTAPSRTKWTSFGWKVTGGGFAEFRFPETPRSVPCAPTEKDTMKTLCTLALTLLLASAAFAQSTGPTYPGPKHTESHGGTYSGGQGGSSHKGGTYTSPTGSHDYGHHKPR
jgi:hypothetical protein